MPVTKTATVTFTVSGVTFDLVGDTLTIVADAVGAGSTRKVTAQIPLPSPLKTALLQQVEPRLSAWVDAQ